MTTAAATAGVSVDFGPVEDAPFAMPSVDQLAALFLLGAIVLRSLLVRLPRLPSGAGKHRSERFMGAPVLLLVSTSVLAVLNAFSDWAAPSAVSRVGVVSAPVLLFHLVTLSRRKEITLTKLIVLFAGVTLTGLLIVLQVPRVALAPALVCVLAARNDSARPLLLVAGLALVLAAHVLDFADVGWMAVAYDAFSWYLCKFRLPLLFAYDAQLANGAALDVEASVETASPPKSLIDLIRTDSGTSDSSGQQLPSHQPHASKHHRRQSSQASTGWSWGIASEELPATPVLVSDDDEEDY